MLSENELEKLHTNQRLLVKELQSRGIDVNILFQNIELIEAALGEHKELILDRDSSINPYSASVVCGDKYLAKRLMGRAGLSVPKGEQFLFNQMDESLIYAQNLGFPVVVKPSFGSHGHDVNMDLENLCQVKSAIESVISSKGKSKGYIIEEQFEGKEYRVFITKTGEFAVLHRDPAHIIGDGVNSIETIAKKISYDRMNPRTTCLCPIALDDIAKTYLARNGLSFASISKIGEKVYLRHNSNVAMGATCEDYTDKVHPSVIALSQKALSVFPGLPYAGIDFMTTDISTEQTQETYRIIEVNSVPGIHIHMKPGTGQPRNVAKYIVDMMFPETK